MIARLKGHPQRVSADQAAWQVHLERLGSQRRCRPFRPRRARLCWIHAERPLHKLDILTDQQRAAQARIRDLVCRFYADLKAYHRELSVRSSRVSQ